MVLKGFLSGFANRMARKAATSKPIHPLGSPVRAQGFIILICAFSLAAAAAQSIDRQPINDSPGQYHPTGRMAGRRCSQPAARSAGKGAWARDTADQERTPADGIGGSRSRVDGSAEFGERPLGEDRPARPRGSAEGCQRGPPAAFPAKPKSCFTGCWRRMRRIRPCILLSA